MSSGAILVTGASQPLGHRVIQLLLERGARPLIVTTGDPSRLADLRERGVEVRRADMDDEASLRLAFEGAERALLVPSMPLSRRLAHHQRALRAMEAVGVQHVVYTSAPSPFNSTLPVLDAHAQTERAIERSSMGYTILRNNLQTEMLTMIVPRALESGVMLDAREGGAVAYVSREDCAQVAAAVLADRQRADRAVLDVAGEEAWTSEDIASLVSEVFGRRVRHQSTSPDVMVERVARLGVPRDKAEALVSLDVGVAQGHFVRVSDVVSRTTGRPALSVPTFIQAHRAALMPA